MSRRTITGPVGRSAPLAGPRRYVAIGVFAGSLLALAIIAAPVSSPRAVAAPGTPGIPQAPLLLFQEDFDGTDATSGAIGLPDYVGSGPGGPMAYLASSSWLPTANRCNGWVADSASPLPPGDAGCATGTSWTAVHNMATKLGIFEGQTPVEAAANQVLAEFTQSPDAVDTVELQTATPVTAGVVSGDRFLQVAAVFVADNCFAGPGPSITISAIGDQIGSGPAPGTGSGTIVPILSAPDLCTYPVVQVDGTYTMLTIASGATKSSLALPSLGLRIEDLNPASGGNDSAVDALELRDLTPQLDLAFGATTAAAGEPVDLALTVTNTTDLLAKPGWSLTDTLPAGLTVIAPGATDCPNGVLAAPPGSTTVALSGDLAAGTASCSATVTVSAAGPGSFTDGPANLALDGVNAPAAALVTVLGGSAPGELAPTGMSLPTLTGLAVAASAMVVVGVALIRRARRKS